VPRFTAHFTPCVEIGWLLKPTGGRATRPRGLGPWSSLPSNVCDWMKSSRSPRSPISARAA
jgi:hypothetical protein